MDVPQFITPTMGTAGPIAPMVLYSLDLMHISPIAIYRSVQKVFYAASVRSVVWNPRSEIAARLVPYGLVPKVRLISTSSVASLFELPRYAGLEDVIICKRNPDT
jgi:hypothetical protein